MIIYMGPGGAISKWSRMEVSKVENYVIKNLISICEFI
jgi:hypothetical protein